ncbi:MAG TPA: choice-of-anchor tandem repeat GloVer-containing protein [Rhizomicrobium sp.]|jgi:uncharacterized repeat protein (TIGR03803 family)|nr:choice-of-anchor tandem repeat GloVer-containing protein [Rhizomicrobium sp.]
MTMRKIVPAVAGLAVSACLALSLMASAGGAQAASLTTLYAFSGSDGAYPAAGVIRDAQGNLYGTTELGGAGGYGTTFKVDTGGNETTLYNFCSEANCADGASPVASLLLDGKGNLSGTTYAGGAYPNCGSGNGCGTVFELAPGGTLTTRHSFEGTDGTFTYARPVKSGRNLYGTVFEGVAGYGAVFGLTLKGVETELYEFQGGADGAYPKAGVIRDKQGNLYGETYGGGTSGHGTLFEIQAGGSETVLYSFAGGTDGVKPSGGLIRDASGNFYGTTEQGGASGMGTVFEVTPGGTETLLHSFAGGSDGASPRAGVVRKGGRLYGTTYKGGTSNDGTVFEIRLKGSAETVLYAFSGSDGQNPDCALVLDTSGNLYGTTFGGGASNDGTVFKLTP